MFFKKDLRIEDLNLTGMPHNGMPFLLAVQLHKKVNKSVSFLAILI